MNKQTQSRISMLLLVLILTPGLMADTRSSDRPDARPDVVPLRRYVMASPRLCLIGPSLLDSDMAWHPVGDAENFARRDGKIRVPMGTRVLFALSRELEGVWYDHAVGTLATSLEIQWCRACRTADEADAHRDTDANDATLVPPPGEWVTLGKDGARDLRRGPSIGTADIGVPVRFTRPGVFHLRGIVRSHAQPVWGSSLTSNAGDVDETDLPPGASDRDVVHVVVHVVERPQLQEPPMEDPSDHPDRAHELSMPYVDDPNAPYVEDAEL